MKHLLLLTSIIVSVVATPLEFNDLVDSSCFKSYMARSESMNRIDTMTKEEDLDGIQKEIFILRGHSLACIQHCKSPTIQESSALYLKFTNDLEEAFKKAKIKPKKKG